MNDTRFFSQVSFAAWNICFRNKLFGQKLQSHDHDHGDTAKHFHVIATNFVYSCNSMKFVSVSIGLNLLERLYFDKTIPGIFHTLYHHHPATTLRVVGTLMTTLLHTARSSIAVSRSWMCNPESLAMVSGKVSFRERTRPEGCHSRREETFFSRF